MKSYTILYVNPFYNLQFTKIIDNLLKPLALKVIKSWSYMHSLTGYTLLRKSTHIYNDHRHNSYSPRDSYGLRATILST